MRHYQKWGGFDHLSVSKNKFTRFFGIKLIYFKSLQIPGHSFYTELLQRHYIYSTQIYDGGSEIITIILVQH